MRPWWDQYPERLEHELQALREAGIPFQVKTKDRVTGELELALVAEIAGTRHRLIARYSTFFPFARVEIFAPDLHLARHQNPFLNNLCLLGRASEAWDLYDTVAGLILKQLPKVLEASGQDNQEKVRGVEEEQGEPATSYLPHLDNAIVLVDSDWVLDPKVTGGELLAGVDAAAATTRIVGAVLEIRDGDGRVLAVANPHIRNRFSHKIRGHWYRLSKPIIEQAPKEFLARLATGTSYADRVSFVQIGEIRADLVAVVFPEEINSTGRASGQVSTGRPGILEQAGRAPPTWAFAHQCCEF